MRAAALGGGHPKRSKNSGETLGAAEKMEDHRPIFECEAVPSMKSVTIYTKPLCPYCVRAISLLKKKGAPIEEISAAFDNQKRAEMIQRAKGARTFPQIFIGDYHVGGCDELYALDGAGKLDPLLNG